MSVSRTIKGHCLSELNANLFFILFCNNATKALRIYNLPMVGLKLGGGFCNEEVVAAARGMRRNKNDGVGARCACNRHDSFPNVKFSGQLVNFCNSTPMLSHVPASDSRAPSQLFTFRGSKSPPPPPPPPPPSLLSEREWGRRLHFPRMLNSVEWRIEDVV